MRAACSEWKYPRRFHVSTGHSETASDTGNMTASDLPGKKDYQSVLIFGAIKKGLGGIQERWTGLREHMEDMRNYLFLERVTD